MDRFMPSAADRSFDASLRRLGVRSWMMVGIALVVAIAYTALSFVSTLVAPLVAATVVGMLCVPAVDRVARWLPRSLAVAVVVLTLIAVVLGSIVVAVAGVVRQASQLRRQLEAGLATVVEWLDGLGFDVGPPEEVLERFGEWLAAAVPGFSGYLTTVFSGAFGLLVAGLIALFILYFVLADWDELSRWVGQHLGVSPDLGVGIIEDTVWSMRQYFYVLTITAFVSAILIGGAMPLLGLPLGFTVAVVTFTTSYIPYLGAIFSSAFAFLIGLGAGSMTEALILLAIILVVQNVVQPMLLVKLAQDRLDLHPIVVFGSTIVGAAFAGILGATLSAPVVAMAVRITRRVRAFDQLELDSEGPGAGPIP
ncbi:MAG: AI-2E family transporter [Acidimicrobiia bacterium]